MSRKTKIRSRLRPDAELVQAIDTSLSTLEHLAKIYHGGYSAIVLPMSVEVRKIVAENSIAAKLRGERLFSSPAVNDTKTRLNALHKLTALRVHEAPPTLEFVPSFFIPEAALVTLPFRDWWNRDVIYRAGAALPGTNPGLLPVNGSPAVPFDKREKMTRREFVELLRNKLGAHEGREMPALLDELEDSRAWPHFSLKTPSGHFRTSDGTIKVKTGIIAATMRQITHEVLLAYGRNDAAPSPP